MAKKVLYKNHCTPQEQISSGGRYYLDSDCGRKLSGSEEFTLGSGTIAYTATKDIGVTGESLGGNGLDFVFIKNTGGNDVLVSLNGISGEYFIKLSDGEAFASKLKVTNANVYVKRDTSDSTIEYYTGT